MKNVVIATGGGIVLNKQNIENLRKTGVIFLHGNLLPGESRFSEWQMRNRLCGIFAAAS